MWQASPLFPNRACEGMAYHNQNHDFDDVSSVESMEIAEIMGRLRAPYGNNQNDTVLSDQTISATPGVEGLETQEDDKSSESWIFELAALKAAIMDVENAPLRAKEEHQIPNAALSTSEEPLSFVEFGDDDDDDVSFMAQEILESRVAIMCTAARTLGESHASYNSSINHFVDSAPNTPVKNSDLLAERRAARAARIEKVQQRLERERLEAETKKKKAPPSFFRASGMDKVQQRKEREAERKKKQSFMVEKAPRQSNYELHRQRKEPKTPIKAKLRKNEDVDLVSWKFNGPIRNAKKVLKLGVRQSG